MKPGECYVSRSEIFVREIIAGPDVTYQQYGIDEGRPMGQGLCSPARFRQWAGRPATEAETKRLQRSAAYLQMLLEARRLIEGIPTEILLDELRRRRAL